MGLYCTVAIYCRIVDKFNGSILSLVNVDEDIMLNRKTRRVFEHRANSISSTGLSIPRAVPEDPNNHGCREGEDGEPRAVDPYTMA